MMNLNKEMIKASDEQVEYALDLQAQNNSFNLFTREDLETMDRDKLRIIVEHLQEQKMNHK